MDEFFLAIAPDLKSHCGGDSRRGNSQQSHNQHQHEQHVAALRARSRNQDIWPYQFLFAWLLLPIFVALSISLYRPVLVSRFLLICAVALVGAAAASARQPAPANAGALTPTEVQRALDILQDPEKRARLIETLQAIAKASPPPIPEKPETNPEPVAPLVTDSLGAQVLEALASGAERLASDAAAAAQTAIDSRLLWGWARRVAADPAQRRAAIDGAWQLALVLIGALLLEGFARAVVRRPIAALMAHAIIAEHDRSGRGRVTLADLER